MKWKLAMKRRDISNYLAVLTATGTIRGDISSFGRCEQLNQAGRKGFIAILSCL